MRKTYKLYVDGAFVRSESGRTDPHGPPGDVANVARASRKDVRDAVVSAREAFARWSSATPILRGQILYRLAEMLDARRSEFVALAVDAGAEEDDAERELAVAVDRTVWYAGWCDKAAELLGSRSPVAAPFDVTSSPEPVGIVGVVAPDEPALLGLVTMAIPPLVEGNAVVALASESHPRIAVVFAECLATCDLPHGVLNVLTGRRIEVAPPLARHMDVDALTFAGLDAPFAAELERLAAENLKDVRRLTARSPSAWYADEFEDLSHVAAFTETKTVWHPARI